MWCGDVGAPQEFGVDLGLVFPAVDNHAAYFAGVARGYKCLSVYNLSAGAVDYYRCAPERLEESLVGKVICGVLSLAGEGSVECYYIGLGGYGVKVHPVVTALGFLPERVAFEHVHVESLCPTLYDRAYMADADYADGIRAQGAVDYVHQRGEDILSHRGGIAAGGVDYRYRA